ncbi:MAG: hypothetical protein OEY43_00850 [Gammaproteobacteria bacterium]|nr:hypothetical protein [Gammaproteobacteria bacterium]
MNLKKIQEAVEAICNQGCREVNNIIALGENNQKIEQIQHLSTDEKIAVINELKNIMDVYKK